MLRSWVATPYRIGVLALVLIVVPWRAWTVSRWTWHVDDWIYLDGTHDLGFVEYLFQDYNGHLMPGGFLITWLVTKVAPLDFRLPVALVAISCGVLVVMWAITLRRLGGERTLLLIPLALLSLSPIFIRPTIWWASALQTIPLQFFIAVSVLLVVRAGRDPRSGDKWRLALLLLGALLFWQKGLLLLVPIVALLVHASDGPLRRRLTTVATLLWPTLLVIAVYVPLFTWHTAGESANSVEISASQVTWGDAGEFFARGVGEVLGPGLLGGPWGTLPTDADPWIHQSGLASFLFSAVMLMGALYVLTRIREGWLLLGAALAYVMVAWGLVLLSNRFQLSGQAASTTERFHADTLSVVVVLLTAALASRPERPRGTRPGIALAHGAMVALIVGSLVVGNVWQARRVGTSPAKPWVSAVTHDIDRLKPVSLWDGTAPDVVLPGFWLEHAHLNNMLAVLPQVTFGTPSTQFYAVLDSGRLAPVTVAPDSRSKPGPIEDCGYSVEPGSTVTVPMTNQLFDWTWGLQVDTLSAEGGELTVTGGSNSVTVDIGQGLQSWQAPFPGSVGSTVELYMSPSGGTVCVAGLTVGNAVTSSS